MTGEYLPAGKDLRFTYLCRCEPSEPHCLARAEEMLDVFAQMAKPHASCVGIRQQQLGAVSPRF